MIPVGVKSCINIYFSLENNEKNPQFENGHHARLVWWRYVIENFNREEIFAAFYEK